MSQGSFKACARGHRLWNFGSWIASMQLQTRKGYWQDLVHVCFTMNTLAEITRKYPIYILPHK